MGCVYVESVSEPVGVIIFAPSSLFTTMLNSMFCRLNDTLLQNRLIHLNCHTQIKQIQTHVSKWHVIPETTVLSNYQHNLPQKLNTKRNDDK